MLLVGMLLLLIQLPSAWGLSHIKLDPKFVESLNSIENSRSKNYAKSFNRLPIDGEISPIYEEVGNYLETEYQRIAERQILDLTIINGNLQLGVGNFLGYSWQRPFGTFSVKADRQVTQNLFAENWIVEDTFTFTIEASHLLNKMNEKGQLMMSETEIGAFAGLSFNRTYTYYHYAPTYEDGLRVDFRKLFFPYRFFYSHKINELGNEEIIRKHDTWSVRVGGLIKTPPLYNVSFSAGALSTLAYEKRINVQKVSEDETFYQLSNKSEKKIELGATLSFQLDFFELLQLTLLRYDLNYEYEKSQAYTLELTQNELNALNVNQIQELNSIIKGRDQVNLLTPYIHKLDESSLESFSQRGSLLLWGGLKKSQTEQVKVIKDEVVHDFYKYYTQSMTLVQNLWSRLFSATIYKVFKIPFGTTNDSLLSKQITLEYKANHHQSHNLNIQRINTLQDFSFTIKKSYQANSTTRWWDYKKKDQAIFFVDHYTSLPKDYKIFIRNDELRGPLQIETLLRVEEAGLKYFLEQAESNIFFGISKVCKSSISYKWIDDAYRDLLLTKDQSGNESCVKNLGLKYREFKTDYVSSLYSPSIRLFKEFIIEFNKKSQRLEEMMILFGTDNTFIHGSLRATTKTDQPFMTAFSAGQFRGLGVIDNFQRSMGSRGPASIISE